MAINLETQYPGKIGPATVDYPYGEPRNITLPSDGTGTPWEAAIVKDFAGFEQALLKSSGIVPSGTPDKVAASQYLQSIIEIASGRAVNYDETGVADAYVLDIQANQQSPASYFTGMIIKFIASNDNTGASTVNVNTLGIKNLKKNDGSGFIAGEILTGKSYEFKYDGVDFIAIAILQEKIYSPEFLQITSDINNGVPISAMRFINPASGEHGKIRARTSVADHTTPFDTAITELNSVGGGNLIVPPGDFNVEDLVPKDGVTINGSIIGVMSSGAVSGSRFVSLGNGSHIFNQTVGTVNSFAINGMVFQGPGAATTGRGIYGLDLRRFSLSNVVFNNFADEAVKLDAGTASIFRNIFAQNCLLDRTQAAKIGVIDVTANDCMFSTMEITTSQAGLGNKSDANLYLCAFNIGGSNHFMNGLIGEISDIGIYLACVDSRITNCRADLNQGHGWQLVDADSNRFSNCSGARNSQDANDTYNQWEVESTSNRNKLVNCNGDGLGADANKAKYGFNDALNSDSAKNRYENCSAIQNVTKGFNIVAFAGSAVSFPMGGPPKTFTAADATPSVDQYTFFKTGAADTYTDFDDGVPGQPIQIFAAHAATVSNNANIKTNTGANKVLVVNKIYTFKDVNGVWYEVE